MSVGWRNRDAIEVAMEPHIWFIASEIADSVNSSIWIFEMLVPSPPIIRFAMIKASCLSSTIKFVPSNPLVYGTLIRMVSSFPSKASFVKTSTLGVVILVGRFMIILSAVAAVPMQIFAISPMMSACSSEILSIYFPP